MYRELRRRHKELADGTIVRVPEYGMPERSWTVDAGPSNVASKPVARAGRENRPKGGIEDHG